MSAFIKHDEPVVKRAAVIVEMEDGTRMLYEYAPRSPISFTLDVDCDELYSFSGQIMRMNQTQRMTVEGLLAGGTVWAGDMPTTEQAQLEAQVLAVEATIKNEVEQ